jgi:hypothetical protein
MPRALAVEFPSRHAVIFSSLDARSWRSGVYSTQGNVVSTLEAGGGAKLCHDCLEHTL